MPGVVKQFLQSRLFFEQFAPPLRIFLIGQQAPVRIAGRGFEIHQDRQFPARHS